MLAPSTIKSYLSSLSQLHKFLDQAENPVFKNIWITAYLKGMENAKVYEGGKLQKRRPVTVEILELIGHQISIINWSNLSKIAVWSAVLLIFWGSFRPGEILVENDFHFDFHIDLLWRDVVFVSENSIVVHIKSGKTTKFPGIFVDIFAVPNSNLCPVAALKNLKFCQQNLKIFSLQEPVFKISNKKYFSKHALNEYLELLLRPLGFLNKDDIISGHSLRSGIPSILASQPNDFSDYELKLWGRWDSSAFSAYSKLKRDQKWHLFHKIISHVLPE